MDGLLWPKVKGMEYDREKFKRLVHYVIWKAGKRDWFGATKLNKVLWFAETRAYMLSGKPITGATYIREKHGPVPKAIMPVRAELEAEGSTRTTGEGKLKRTTATAAPDLSAFSADEIKTVDWWIDHLDRDHTAGTISDASHDYTWEIAAMGEPIPMHAVFVTRIREEPSPAAMAWAREAAARLGLS